MRILREKPAAERAKETPDRCVACTRRDTALETYRIEGGDWVGLCVNFAECNGFAEGLGIFCVYP